MLQAIQDNTAIRHYLPASSKMGGVMTAVATKGPDMGKRAKTEVSAELTEKLNKLAKGRPFSIMYRVKKYDPL
jgi:siroheme synthase (precorrin-2 oxidase/ferrochelatase)